MKRRKYAGNIVAVLSLVALAIIMYQAMVLWSDQGDIVCSGTPDECATYVVPTP